MGAVSVRHIPVCPFRQRLEILLALKNHSGTIGFHVVDTTEPRGRRSAKPAPSPPMPSSGSSFLQPDDAAW